MIDIVEQIIEDGPFRDFRAVFTPANGIGRVCWVAPAGVLVHAEEDIVLDPCIRSIQFEAFIRRSIEGIADDLEDSRWTIAAGEGNRVARAPGMPEVVAAEDRVARSRRTIAAHDEGRSRRRVEGARIAWESGIGDEEGTIVRVGVGHRR